MKFIEAADSFNQRNEGIAFHAFTHNHPTAENSEPARRGMPCFNFHEVKADDE